ncbi:zinc-binding dehydrogenase [Candidatus Acetothermia bacterium]|nr:zinc-binding dehydrogenase [Candidatus Acetothermia bacterium]
MRTIFLERHGSPEQAFAIREQPIPTPAANEVLIKVIAIGINYAEVLMRRGLYPVGKKLPYVPGFEASGTIEKLGPGGTQLKVGQRVVVMVPLGAYSEYICTNAANVILIPEKMSFEDAAAMPVNFATAYHCLFNTGVLFPGDRVLIHACAGGVGLAAVQFCKNAGVEIFGTASSDEKIKFLKEYGVHHPINYRTEDFSQKVRELTNGEGIDFVLDSLGGETLKKSMKLLRANGRLASIGVSSFTQKNKLQLLWELLRRPRLDALSLLQHSTGFYGVYLARFADRPKLFYSIMQNVLAQYTQGKIKPHIGKTFPFEKVAEAHALLEGRYSIGKLILLIRRAD